MTPTCAVWDALGNPSLKWGPTGRMFGSPLGPVREEGRWACSTARLNVGPQRVFMGSPQMVAARSRTPQGSP